MYIPLADFSSDFIILFISIKGFKTTKPAALFLSKMESDNLGNCPAGSRWNPTKDQMNMLESLYMQGLRTPSAQQIQQITNRLRVFGQIEGKNVFYWFQNDKVRQR